MIDESQGWLDANRRWWDERVAIHVASAFYDVEAFRRGRSTLEPFERAELADAGGRSLVHLQCHFGLDTLSWARHGALVTGLDFSSSAVEAAAALASSVGVEAAFVCGSLDNAPALLNTRFDVVYTGKGALCWLPDLDRWAGIVTELLAPGGSLYLVEFHPFIDVFSYRELTVESSYFRPAEEIVDEDRRGSYADLTAPTVHNRTVQWSHTMGDIVSAISDHGLRIRFLHEFPYTLYPRWPWLEADPQGMYRLPAGIPPLPMLFSIRADRP